MYSKPATRFSFWVSHYPFLSVYWLRRLRKTQTRGLARLKISVCIITRSPRHRRFSLESIKRFIVYMSYLERKGAFYVRESRTVLDSGFHVVDFGFQVLDSSLCQRNLDSEFQSWGDSGFLELYSGFQSPGFWIPQTKFQRIPDSTSKNSENLDSLHGVRRKSLISIFGKQTILPMLSLTPSAG